MAGYSFTQEILDSWSEKQTKSGLINRNSGFVYNLEKLGALTTVWCASDTCNALQVLAPKLAPNWKQEFTVTFGKTSVKLG